MTGRSAGTRGGGVVLVGFMGAGKSTVGALLAERLGLPVYDVDDEVARRAGKSIADIFATEGEQRFRKLEADVVSGLPARGAAVICTGGGALGLRANRAALARCGAWVWLKVCPDTVWKRVGGDDGRPLLNGDETEARRRMEALMKEREPLYAAARFHVETDGASPPEIVDAVCAELRRRDREPGARAAEADGGIDRTAASGETMVSCRVGTGADGRGRGPSPVAVSLGPRTYPVYVGIDCLASLGELLNERVAGRRALVVTNPTVGKLFGDAVEASLTQAGFHVRTATMPDGERHKTLDTVSRLYDAALAAGLDRKGVVVALGGGVVGDTAGFLAATYMRGVPFVQVPTTLLAQVDASVGGKVGVNHDKGKNLIGAFHQPRLVLADVSTLDSLPDREWLSGMAEVIKEGLLADAALFEFVEKRGVSRDAWDVDAVKRAVRRSVEIKADVVSSDERESGSRAVLNLGHTVGHAVEALTGYDHDVITHGEAVALGTLTACLVSERLAGFPPAETARVRSFLGNCGYPVWHGGTAARDVVEAIRHDKKVVDGDLTMALLRRIGDAVVYSGVPQATLEEALREQIGWAKRGGEE